jgi:hypothetical protein
METDLQGHLGLSRMDNSGAFRFKIYLYNQHLTWMLKHSPMEVLLKDRVYGNEMPG